MDQLDQEVNRLKLCWPTIKAQRYLVKHYEYLLIKHEKQIHSYDVRENI